MIIQIICKLALIDILVVRSVHIIDRIVASQYPTGNSLKTTTERVPVLAPVCNSFCFYLICNDYGLGRIDHITQG